MYKGLNCLFERILSDLGTQLLELFVFALKIVLPFLFWILLTLFEYTLQ